MVTFVWSNFQTAAKNSKAHVLFMLGKNLVLSFLNLEALEDVLFFW